MKNLFITFFALLSFCVGSRASSPQFLLPHDVSFNNDAGRGGWIIINIRLTNVGDVPFVVDTGSPITLCDKSLEPELGKRLGTTTVITLRGKQQAHIYATPKLYLQNTPLLSGPQIFSYDFSRLSARSHHHVMGIIGMDCLLHYCIQFDFRKNTMCFLNGQHSNTAVWGKAFPLTFSHAGQRADKYVRPYIHHAGLLGGGEGDALIDTGCHIDGFVERGVAKGHFFRRLGQFFIFFEPMHWPECKWDNEKYADLRVIVRDHLNILGLRFLARHLVTLDFPKHMLYLRKTSSAAFLLAVETKSVHH